MIRKIFVCSFQHPEISCIFGRHPTVFAKQNPVLIFFKEFFCSNGLPSDFSYDRSELNNHIWECCEQTVKRRKIIGKPSEMRCNKSSMRMTFKNIMLFCNQCVP